MIVGEAPSAASLIGALADEQRRTVFAAVQLGASSVDEIVAATSLAQAQVAKALGKLVEVGAVASREGSLVVPTAVFPAAARVALSRPASDEHDGLSGERRKVMDAFVVGGRLSSIPASQAKRVVVLDWLAQEFEPGRRYSESMVNLVLGQRHPDTAALRRYLVDEGFLHREAGEYWRAGGSTTG